jgi:AcrR family transcriptional regulator
MPTRVQSAVVERCPQQANRRSVRCPLKLSISRAMTAARKTSTPKRKTFRHGNLRRVLLDAGIELAGDGGPSAVALREATRRRAGVAPNAAYRHFSSHNDLLQAVRSDALSLLARATERQTASTRNMKDPSDLARAIRRAVGTGYLKFALTGTGLFRTAFSVPDKVEDDLDPTKTGKTRIRPQIKLRE